MKSWKEENGEIFLWGEETKEAVPVIWCHIFFSGGRGENMGADHRAMRPCGGIRKRLEPRLFSMEGGEGFCKEHRFFRGSRGIPAVF